MQACSDPERKQATQASLETTATPPQDPSVDAAINEFLESLLQASVSDYDKLTPKQQANLYSGYLHPCLDLRSLDSKLYLACELGKLDIVSRLLDGRQSKHLIVNYREKDKSTPLLIATQRNHTKVILRLLQVPNIDVNVQWPLIISAEKGNLQVVVALLAAKARVNLGDEFKTTALYEVAKHNQLAVARVLLERGANQVPRVDGSVPVSVAAEKGHVEMLQLLLVNKASLTATLTKGASSLYLAAQNNHITCARVLLDSDRSLLTLCDDTQRSPIWIAAAQGHIEMTSCLMSYLPKNSRYLLNLKDTEFNKTALEIARAQGFFKVADPLVTCVQEAKFASINDAPCSQNSNSDGGVRSGECESGEAREQGKQLFYKRQYASALNAFLRALKLDPSSVFAASNAAEAALQLNQPADALVLARQALQLDPGHFKSRLRVVRALSMLERGAEALVWAADWARIQSGDCMKALADLDSAIGKCSPFCSQLARGLVVCAAATASDGIESLGYKVVATKALKQQQVLSLEVAVVPWTYHDVWEEARVKRFLQTVDLKDSRTISRLNGIFPRTYKDIPWAVASLSRLPALITKYSSLWISPESQQYLRLLACAKTTAHDDGIHHFGSFYNHSCSPNAEVRGSRDLCIVSNQAVTANSEVTISYLQLRELDDPVAIRRLRVQKGWGCLCKCPRCLKEMERKDEEAMIDEAAWLALQGPLVDVINADSDVLLGAFLSSGNSRSSWQSEQWKEAFVYQVLFQRVSAALPGFQLTILPARLPPLRSVCCNVSTKPGLFTTSCDYSRFAWVMWLKAQQCSTICAL